MSVNSPVVGLTDPALARAVAPATGQVLVPARTQGSQARTALGARRARRIPGAHRDPRSTFWRTIAQELVFFGTAGQVRPWRAAR